MPEAPVTAPPVEQLRDEWAAAWPSAVELWSPFVRLREPTFVMGADDARREVMGSGSFAQILLVNQSVMVDLDRVAALGLGGYAQQVLAHEVGHHVLAPADLSTHARLIAASRRALPGVEREAPLVANLWTDLLINDRLQRRRGVDMAAVFVALKRADGEGSAIWDFYQRTYEVLWGLVRATLTSAAELDDRIEADAQLASRLVRVFADRPVRGGAAFAALCLPYFLQLDGTEGAGGDELLTAVERAWSDVIGAAAGGFPDGMTSIDDTPIIHPLHDPEVSGAAAGRGADDTVEVGASAGGSTGQYREPFEYGELLRATGVDISAAEAARRYYRERARPHLIRYPSRPQPVATDPLMEGLEMWDPGAPLEAIDWPESLARSPVAIPGVTTVQRTWGTSVGGDPATLPLDLDLYVDCSGSMPNPQQATSFPALAGTIVALSALRAGASVQVTLWSGASQFQCTDGFGRDDDEILAVLTGYFGGGTAFPIHVLRDTWLGPEVHERAAHVLIVSDAGVDTLFATDEQGNPGRSIAQRAIAAAGGGASMVLQLHQAVEDVPMLRDAIDDGWDVNRVRDWDDLVVFARHFSRTVWASSSVDPSGKP